MKITIDTLPLWDAFRQTDVCPFCHLESRMEELYIDTYLGESVMEPDTRVEVNEKGFCPEHYRSLFQQKASKLGLALMTHTHLKQLIGSVGRHIGKLEGCCGNESVTLLKRVAGAKDCSAALEEAAAFAGRSRETCVVCQRVQLHMERYYETALHMWWHDTDFRRLFEQGKGFCIPHWGAQLKACKGILVTNRQAEFIRKLNEIEQKALSELERDLEWFTRKFDYRNADKPWGNSRDALPRAINMIEGRIVKPES